MEPTTQPYVLVPAPQVLQGNVQIPSAQFSGWGPPHGSFGPPFVPPPLILLGIVLLFLVARRASWFRQAGVNGWSFDGMLGPSRSNGAQQDRAMMIARERLAGGEITTEEFETIRKTLSSS